MNSKPLALIFILQLFFNWSCVESPKKGTLLTDTIDQNKLTVDAGPTLYTQGTILTKATVSNAPSTAFSWTAPAGVTIESATSLNTNVSATIEGIYQLSLTASSEEKSSSDTVNLVIDKTAPTVNAGADLANAGDPFIPSSSASDTSPLTYLWTKVSGPGAVTFSNSQILRPTISMAAAGSYVLQLTATDAAGNSANDTIAITADMLAPVISDLTAEIRNASFSKSVVATDDSALTYLWSKVSGTGNISFSASASSTTSISADADGVYVIKVTVTDLFANTASKTFTLTWDSTAPSLSLASFNTNKATEITATVTELTPTTYLWEKTAGPGTITFSNSASKSTTVSASQDGTYTLKFTVTDHFGLSSSQTTQFIRDQVAPAINLGSSPLHANGPFNILPTLTETNPVKTYKWSALAFQPLSMLLFSSDTVLNPVVTATGEGKYRLTLSVTDGAGNKTSSEIYLFWDVTAPTVTAPNDLELNTATSITASANDSSADAAWTSAPAGVTFTPNDNLTTIVSAADGNYVLTITVTDVAGNIATDTTNLLWDSTAPVITMPTNVITNAPINLDATTSDMTPMTYNWSKVSGPGTVIFNTQTAEDSIASASGEGTYVVKLTATDQLGNSNSDTVQMIWDTTPPTVNSGVDAIKSSSFSQNATASDDRGTITYSWSKVSGPGNLSFTTSTTEDPAIVADADGDYIVKLEVTDDAGNSNSDTFNLKWDTTAPIVNAGTDKSTNASISQDATVTESNLLTVLWTQESGPGTVTFGSPASIDTTLTANIQGTYVLKLTATDTAGNSSSDTMTLIWDTTAPVINAGTDQKKNASYTQNATITDALSGMGTYLWSKVSGPGTITFVNASVVDPTLSANTDGTYVIQVTATDIAGNSGTDAFQLIWDTSLPTVNAGIDQIKAAVFTQDATVSDATNITYSWSKQSGPGSITFGISTAEDTTISASADGSYVIKLTATDELANAASDTFNLTWDTTNPAVNSGADELRNSTFLKTAIVTDANSALGMTYLWQKVSGPGTINFSSSTTVSTNISASLDGDYIIRLTATDIAGFSGTDEFALTWDTTPPAVNAGSDQVKSALFSQTGSATDLNGVTVLWSKFSGPGIITFSSAATLASDFSADSDGTYVIKLTATDDAGNSASDTFSLSWDSAPPAVNAGIDQNTKIQVTQNATVTDGSGIASYQWSDLGATGNINFGSATSEDTTISATADGSYTLRLSATDNAGNSNNDTISFVWDTTAPTVNAGSDQEKKTNFVQTATASDALGILSYSWSKTSGPGTVSFSNNTVLNPTISASTDGSYIISFTATDSAGNSASDSFALNWDSSNPVVNAGSDQIKTALFTQDATVSDNSSLSYLWEKVSGPGSITFGSATSEDTTIVADSDGQYIIRLTATDSLGNSANDSFTLTWDETAPSINMGAASELKRTAFTKNITVTDANSALGLTYAWSKLAGPGTVNFSSTSIEDPTISASADGSYTIQVVATDIAGQSSSDTFTLIWDTTAPTINAGADEFKNIAFAHAGTASDSNGLASTVWSSAPAAGISFSDTSILNPTITVTVDGSYTITLTATDNAGNSSSDSYTLLFDSAIPLVDAGMDVITRTATFQNAMIVEGNIQTIAWSGAGLTFSNTATEDTTISAAIDGVYTATLTVTDKSGSSANDTMNFTWDTAAPSVNAGLDQAKNAAFTQNASISDATTSTTILWSLSSGPGAISFSDANIEDPQISAATDGTYIITATATDQAGNSNSDSFTLLWDTTAPSVTLASPQSGDSSFTPNPLISDSSSYSCSWTHTGSGTPTFTPNNTSCNPTISDIPAGVHSFELSVTDALLNGPTVKTVAFTSSGAKLAAQLTTKLDGIIYYFDVEQFEDQQAYCELLGRQMMKEVEWSIAKKDHLCKIVPKAFVRLTPSVDAGGTLKSLQTKAERTCPKELKVVCMGIED